MATLTTEERKAILDREVSQQVRAGWRIVSRTDTTAQLVYQQSASACLGIILLLICIVPGILYFMFASKIRNLYIEVDEEGQIKRTQN